MNGMNTKTALSIAVTTWMKANRVRLRDEVTSLRREVLNVWGISSNDMNLTTRQLSEEIDRLRAEIEMRGYNCR
jgi:hypothetical protein